MITSDLTQCILVQSHRAHIGPHMGPWAPKGTMPPGGFFWALWGPKGPTRGTGGLRGSPRSPPEAPGAFLEKLGFWPPGGLRPGGPQPLLSGKWLASQGFFSPPKTRPPAKSPCCSLAAFPTGTFYSPPEMKFFYFFYVFIFPTYTPEKKVLREGSPGPTTPLDGSGPRFRVRGCAVELAMLT